LGGAIAYDALYSAGYGGVLKAYDVKTGAFLWNSTLNNGELEAPYPYYPIGSGAGVSIADHKVYVTTGEYSVTQPLHRG
jgi:outer membrane protein assembly factor BamB